MEDVSMILMVNNIDTYYNGKRVACCLETEFAEVVLPFSYYKNKL